MIKKTICILWVIITFVIIFNVSATENTCSHINFTDIYSHTEYSQIALNDKEHHEIHHYDTVCDNCSHKLNTTQKSKSVIHDFKGNACLSCNYQRR